MLRALGGDIFFLEITIPPLLMRGDSAEAANLWHAYGWSRTIGPDLLQAIKEPFLEVLRHGEANTRTYRNLTIIFMALCLEAPNELTEEEVGSVVDAMSEEDLKTILECLTQRLAGGPAEQAQVWREKVSPWLERYWPRAVARNTAATSTSILNMLAVCGCAFPEAAAWSLNYLQPTQEGLLRLHGSKQPGRHPKMALQILGKVVGNEGVPTQHRNTLRAILDEMLDAMSGLRTDAKFQKLYGLAVK